MFCRVAFLVVIAAMCALPSSAATPPVWRVDASRSSLTFEVMVNGQIVTGRFPGFGSLIRFDPADLSNSSARITIDATGIKTNDTTRDAMLLKPAWFNVLDFPQANFQSTSFSSTGPNKYLCKGRLTIKGVSRDIDLPFALVINGTTATMSGESIIKRLDFKVGEGPDYTTDVPVALSVKVMVKIKATKAK